MKDVFCMLLVLDDVCSLYVAGALGSQPEDPPPSPHIILHSHMAVYILTRVCAVDSSICVDTRAGHRTGFSGSAQRTSEPLGIGSAPRTSEPLEPIPVPNLEPPHLRTAHLPTQTLKAILERKCFMRTA